jgi:hypothetical protein
MIKKVQSSGTPAQMQINKALSENVVGRVSNMVSYQSLKNKGHATIKALSYAIAGLQVLSILAIIANLLGYNAVMTLLLLMFLAVGSVTVGLCAYILTSTNAEKMEYFISENKVVLQQFFLDFIKAKMPEYDKTYTTNFKLETIVDNNDVASRAIKMTGMCQFKKESAELSVTLRFNPSHSKLEVQKYDISKMNKY